MILSVKLFDHVYNFSSLKEVMAKANERKSGDALAGIAASSSKERVAAKVVLSKITLKDLKENPAVPYEEDEGGGAILQRNHFRKRIKRKYRRDAATSTVYGL